MIPVPRIAIFMQCVLWWGSRGEVEQGAPGGAPAFRHAVEDSPQRPHEVNVPVILSWIAGGEHQFTAGRLADNHAGAEAPPSTGHRMGIAGTE
jgi:hypothetical protein